MDVRIPVKSPHADATAYSFDVLRYQFRDAEVGSDWHMLFSEPGKVEQSLLAPDVLVALNVPRGTTRDDYDADLEGPPDFVLEVLSRGTWEHDLGRKLDCYQRIGVRECLLFDAMREDVDGLGKELWGFAMTPESREPLAEVALPNGERGVCSAVLGLVAHVTERLPPLRPNGVWALTMRWHDPATAEDLPDYDEACDRAEAAWREREAAEREWEETLEAQRVAEAERAGREEAQREAREERSRREAEQRQREAAERRIAELEALLRRDER